VVPGIDWGSGNLGQGPLRWVGFALAIRARKRKDHVYVMMSDGEQVKGRIAEARRIASHHGLAGITALVDCNNIQISGRTHDIMKADIPSLWKVDGWGVIECDGHDTRNLYKALAEARTSRGPTVIICHTLMGKGVSFMEESPITMGRLPRGVLQGGHERAWGVNRNCLTSAFRNATLANLPSRQGPMQKSFSSIYRGNQDLLSRQTDR
jgi:transketolase